MDTDTQGRIAPDGSLWVCTACGKTARDLFGPGVQSGWDASCMLNAILVTDANIVYDEGGLVFEVRNPEVAAVSQAGNLEVDDDPLQDDARDRRVDRRMMGH